MKQRKMPLRKCTGCGEMKEKRELIRVVKAPDTKDENGEIIADSATCSEQAPNCFIKDIDLQNITIPGLFGMIRSALNNDQIVDNGTQFNFDQTYGVPEWISLKTSGQFPWYWHVESFEIIE